MMSIGAGLGLIGVGLIGLGLTWLLKGEENEKKK